jgi:hypothetical protein
VTTSDLYLVRSLAIQYLNSFDSNLTLKGLKRPLTDSEILILAYIHATLTFQNSSGILTQHPDYELEPLDFSPEVEE